MEENYEEGDILLSEEDVFKVLSLRNGEKDLEKLWDSLEENGYSEIKKRRNCETMTEREAEKTNLLETIIRLEGENPFEVNTSTGIFCPTCRSKMIAAIGWWGWKDGLPSYVEYMKVTGKELFYNSCKTYHDENSENYHCLQCGCKFK